MEALGKTLEWAAGNWAAKDGSAPQPISLESFLYCETTKEDAITQEGLRPITHDEIVADIRFAQIISHQLFRETNPFAVDNIAKAATQWQEGRMYNGMTYDTYRNQFLAAWFWYRREAQRKKGVMDSKEKKTLESRNNDKLKLIMRFNELLHLDYGLPAYTMCRFEILAMFAAFSKANADASLQSLLGIDGSTKGFGLNGPIMHSFLESYIRHAIVFNFCELVSSGKQYSQARNTLYAQGITLSNKTLLKKRNEKYNWDEYLATDPKKRYKKVKPYVLDIVLPEEYIFIKYITEMATEEERDGFYQKVFAKKDGKETWVKFTETFTVDELKLVADFYGLVYANAMTRFGVKDGRVSLRLDENKTVEVPVRPVYRFLASTVYTSPILETGKKEKTNEGERSMIDRLSRRAITVSPVRMMDFFLTASLKKFKENMKGTHAITTRIDDLLKTFEKKATENNSFVEQSAQHTEITEIIGELEKLALALDSAVKRGKKEVPGYAGDTPSDARYDLELIRGLKTVPYKGSVPMTMKEACEEIGYLAINTEFVGNPDIPPNFAEGTQKLSIAEVNIGTDTTNKTITVINSLDHALRWTETHASSLRRLRQESEYEKLMAATRSLRSVVEDYRQATKLKIWADSLSLVIAQESWLGGGDEANINEKTAEAFAGLKAHDMLKNPYSTENLSADEQTVFELIRSRRTSMEGYIKKSRTPPLVLPGLCMYLFMRNYGIRAYSSDVSLTGEPDKTARTFDDAGGLVKNAALESMLKESETEDGVGGVSMRTRVLYAMTVWGEFFCDMDTITKVFGVSFKWVDLLIKARNILCTTICKYTQDGKPASVSLFGEKLLLKLKRHGVSDIQARSEKVVIETLCEFFQTETYRNISQSFCDRLTENRPKTIGEHLRNYAATEIEHPIRFKPKYRGVTYKYKKMPGADTRIVKPDGSWIDPRFVDTGEFVTDMTGSVKRPQRYRERGSDTAYEMFSMIMGDRFFSVDFCLLPWRSMENMFLYSHGTD